MLGKMLRLSEEQVAAHQKKVKGGESHRLDKTESRHDSVAGAAHPTKRGKYKNEPTWVDGIRFDSKKEAKRYQELKLLEQGNEIVAIQIQPKFALDVNGIFICFYIGDFQYFDLIAQRDVIEDCKGVRTPVYKLKKKLMKAIYGIEIRET